MVRHRNIERVIQSLGFDEIGKVFHESRRVSQMNHKNLNPQLNEFDAQLDEWRKEENPIFLTTSKLQTIRPNQADSARLYRFTFPTIVARSLFQCNLIQTTSFLTDSLRDDCASTPQAEPIKFS